MYVNIDDITLFYSAGSNNGSYITRITLDIQSVAIGLKLDKNKTNY